MRLSVLLLAGAVFLPACERAAEAPKENDAKAPAAKTNAPPPLTIAAWFGSDPLTLDGLKGKVVIVDFWNTSCGPCRRLMPHLAELYAKHKAEGLVVIGVTNDEKSDLEAYLKDNPAGYPIALDTVKGGAELTFDAYGIKGMPTVFLIGRDGSLSWKGPGSKLTDAMVEGELAKK